MPDLFGNDDRDEMDYRRGPAPVKNGAAPPKPAEPVPPHLTADAIAACGMCDPQGYRGLHVCDHVDHREAAKRGSALVREILQKGRPA